jgi:hypothetical protein
MTGREVARVSTLGAQGQRRDDRKYADGLGEHLVIANMARLAHAWRGMGGVGRFLAGSVFLMLRDMAACIDAPQPV